MRVAFVLEEARIDGTVRFAARQTRRLIERGHEVAVVCAPGRLQHAFAPAPTTLIESLAPNAPAVAATDLLRLRHACARADLVVAVAGKAFPAAVAAGLDAPILLDLLSNDLFVGDTLEIGAAVREAAEHGFVIAHAIDDARAHGLRYGFSPHDVRFVPLPVELVSPCAPIDRLQFAAPHEQLILSAARLDDDHAAYFPALFEAIEILRERGYAVRLLVVGGGTHAKALQRIAPDCVTFLGFRSDLDALYALADVYVGEGSSRLEAALAGAPVISSCAQTHPADADRALFLFGMQHGTLHTYTPSTATPLATFAEAIALVLDDGRFADRIAARARERVEHEHAPDRFVTFLERFEVHDNRTRDAPGLAPATTILRVQNERDAIIAAGRRAAADHNLGIILENELAWSDYSRLPEDLWDPIADAARRLTLHSALQTAKPSPLLP